MILNHIEFVFLISLFVELLCYKNPVQGARDSPDPGVISIGDYYYATTTGGQNGKAFPLWRSKDLFNWQQIGYGLYQLPVWAEKDFWAPEIHLVKGSFHLYFTARDKTGHLCIGLAIGQKVTGPFIANTQPLVRNQTQGVIDCTIYQFSNGTIYLLYKTDGNAHGKPTQIMAALLSNDGKKVVGKNIVLFTNTFAWERGIVEAPWVVYHNSMFYIFYSSCGYGNVCYSVDVARSQTLLGPYQKYPQPILHTRNPETQNSWEGPGHCSVVKTKQGNFAIVYHAWPHGQIFTKRVMLVDQLKWVNGWPKINQGFPSQNQVNPF